MMAKKNHFFLGFFLGSAASFALTWFLSPQTGSQIVATVKNKTNSLRQDNMADDSAFENATNELKNQLGRAKDAINQKQTGFDDIVIDGKSAFAKAKDDLDTPTPDIPLDPEVKTDFDAKENAAKDDHEE